MANVSRGAILGVICGSFLALLVVIPRTLGPIENDLPASLWVVAATYVLGGLWAGLIAGALSSRIRTWYQAGFVGVLATLPFMIALGITDSGENRTDIIIAVVVLSLLLGFPLGIIMRKIIREVDPFGEIDL